MSRAVSHFFFILKALRSLISWWAFFASSENLNKPGFDHNAGRAWPECRVQIVPKYRQMYDPAVTCFIICNTGEEECMSQLAYWKPCSEGGWGVKVGKCNSNRSRRELKKWVINTGHQKQIGSYKVRTGKLPRLEILFYCNIVNFSFYPKSSIWYHLIPFLLMAPCI